MCEASSEYMCSGNRSMYDAQDRYIYKTQRELRRHPETDVEMLGMLLF